MIKLKHLTEREIEAWGIPQFLLCRDKYFSCCI